MLTNLAKAFCSSVVLLALAAFANAEDSIWIFDTRHSSAAFATGDAMRGTIEGEGLLGEAEHGGGWILDGRADQYVVAPVAADADLPDIAITLSAWVSIEMPQRWGGIIGSVQDNGGYEKGWVLGYNNSTFTFGLSTEGADDGDGHMTYLAADGASFEIGRWHHVVATYDGETARIYVDGELEGETNAQSGPILYDDRSPFVIGAYLDANEHYRHDGRIKSVRMLDRALSATEVARLHAENAELNSLAPWIDTRLVWMVYPFLTNPKTDGMTVVFETPTPTLAELEYRHESGSDRGGLASSEPKTLHHFRLSGLETSEKYFYTVRVEDAAGQSLQTDLLSFRTAAAPGEPFTFIAIGDTQAQAPVVRRIAELAYDHRPNLLVHAGDLVSTGTNKAHWVNHFFPNMKPVLDRVPIMAVLGNHEIDAQLYYDYFDPPEPRSYYTFSYGDAEFFMIDGNRPLGEGSDQIRWLEEALSTSKAPWKFAFVHQPPYTSDSDDYGNTFQGPSNRGDPNVQNIIPLLERHGVDICFSGHVHDYERTFPIHDGKVTPHERGGVVYVTTAGGGGSLENFDPSQTWFGHKKRRVHHMVYVAIHADHLEFQAIDEEGRLFDTMSLREGRLIGHEHEPHLDQDHGDSGDHGHTHEHGHSHSHDR